MSAAIVFARFARRLSGTKAHHDVEMSPFFRLKHSVIGRLSLYAPYARRLCSCQFGPRAGLERFPSSVTLAGSDIMSRKWHYQQMLPDRGSLAR